jgi:hypothetical protein
MSVQLFKAVLPLVLRAEEAERNLLVRELKTVLQRYLEPDYQKDHTFASAESKLRVFHKEEEARGTKDTR